MKALGLIFDLSEFGNGKVFIKHTPERKKELLEKIKQVLAADVLSPKDAESLRGRIQWYESYLCGRVANLAIHRVGKRALSTYAHKTTKLDEELKASLKCLCERIDNGTPLELSANTEAAIFVFTDGAYEPGATGGSVGGIIFDESGRPLKFFSETIPSILLDQFLTEAENPIYLVELLACYISVYLLGPEFFGRYVVSYIDNEASRLALIKAYSSTELGNVVVRLYIRAEERWQWKNWFGRVCSHSNPADAPSRFENEELLRSGATQTQVPWDRVILDFQSVQHSVWG